MLLEVKEDNSNIILSYENNTEYVPLRDKVEDEYYEQFDNKYEIVKEYVFDSDSFYDKYDKEMIKIAHKKYYNCFEYCLEELLMNLKVIAKKYKGYRVLDYSFNSIFLNNDSEDLNHCDFSTEEELCYMDFKLTSEPLTKFIEFLEQQTQMGDINVRRFRCELTNEE